MDKQSNDVSFGQHMFSEDTIQTTNLDTPSLPESGMYPSSIILGIETEQLMIRSFNSSIFSKLAIGLTDTPTSSFIPRLWLSTFIHQNLFDIFSHSEALL